MHDSVYPRGLNVRQMLDLLAVVKNGGVTAAARVLNVSQPALSRSIRQLEDALGVPLLERQGRGVVPTAHGLTVVRHAETIEAELRHAGRDLANLRLATPERITIGSSPISSAMFLGPAVTLMRERMPEVAVSVANHTYGLMLDRLEQGEIDMVIGAFTEANRRPRLVEEALRQNTLSLLARAGHPLDGRDDLTFADLTDCDWVMAHGSTAIRELVANEFRFEGLDVPEYAVETDDMICVKSLVLSGDFVCANPAELFANEIERGEIKVLPIRWHGGSRTVGFTLREHATVTPGLAALIDALRIVARSIKS